MINRNVKAITEHALSEDKCITAPGRRESCDSNARFEDKKTIRKARMAEMKDQS
jgi:hypothetical protein